MAGMASNVWKWLEITGWKWFGVAKNGWKLLEMEGISGNGWQLINIMMMMLENQVEWPSSSFDCVFQYCIEVFYSLQVKLLKLNALFKKNTPLKLQKLY